jgi:phytoene synthase
VYAFCRIVDDSADEAASNEAAQQALTGLRRELKRDKPPRQLVRAFLNVAERRGIDLASAHELIDGCASDLGTVRIQSDRELLRYCYRVAGTVGLMMSSVLGVSDPEARHHAIDLGVGMQLTNICRDVLEDARRDRVYLPAERLEAAGVTQQALLNVHGEGDADDSEVRQVVARVVDELLDIADDYYESADRGMHYIPLRCRPAILVASRVYRAIGVRLRTYDCDALRGRTVVPAHWKAYWVMAGLFALVSTNRFRDARPALTHDSALHDELAGLPGAHGQ